MTVFVKLVIRSSRKERGLGVARDNGYDERRERILDAAMSLILYFGYDKTTVSDIAKRAGISKGAIYLHFTHKEAIIDELVLREMGRLTEDTITAMEQDAQDLTFTRMYQITFAQMKDAALFKALIRNDEHVFGSYFDRTELDLVRFKRQSRYPTLKAMQDVGALRQDLDLEAVDSILHAFTYGLFHDEAGHLEAQGKSLDDLIMPIGDMLDRWLLPDDGGNHEAGKQVLLNMLRDYRERMRSTETMMEEEEKEDEDD